MLDNVGWLLLIGANVFSLCLMGIDKQRAIHHQWRISESTLMGVALLGGSIGILLGMTLFHHKTSKPLFYLGVPLIIGVQLYILLQLA